FKIYNIIVLFDCKGIDIFSINKKKTAFCFVLTSLFALSAAAQGLNARFLGQPHQNMPKLPDFPHKV
ncbi:MAG: hypothetical protein KBT13_03770, partial [Bacteroidales bacterium]|nr:hypothetical protein [Candidatus Sodaliphilus limicaballi]